MKNRLSAKTLGGFFVFLYNNMESLTKDSHLLQKHNIQSSFSASNPPQLAINSVSFPCCCKAL
ncbi:hypothetical protein, partial [Bacillus pseudomycoides]|uniref:hypothetical protein n=1 Tax=Bacillus pseudomycoides TaxID=64104 RepID=UPI001C3F4395